MIRLDGLLISLFERFSHWTQRTVGVTSRHWTRFFALLAAVLVVIVAVDDHSLGEWLIDSMFLVTCFSRFSQDENRSGESSRESVMNPQKIGLLFVFTRVTMVAVSTTLLFTDACWPSPNDSDHYGVYAIVFLVYFDACDDLPVGKSRLRQWMESAASTLKKAEVAA